MQKEYLMEVLASWLYAAIVSAIGYGLVAMNDGPKWASAGIGFAVFSIIFNVKMGGWRR